jgi:hypothetical protein
LFPGVLKRWWRGLWQLHKSAPIAHEDMDAKRIMELLTRPVERSGFWR